MVGTNQKWWIKIEFRAMASDSIEIHSSGYEIIIHSFICLSHPFSFTYD